MAETAVNAYATTGTNAPANSPTPVAVVSDGTGDRQIVVLGAGDGTTTLVDGTSSHPLAVMGGQYQSAPPGTYSNNQYVPILTDNFGQPKVVVVGTANANISVGSRTSSSTITSVVGANTTTQLLASNGNRTGAYFYNDSTAILYLAFATSASTTAYTLQIPAQGFFEMPVVPVYTGAIFGIWASAAGNVRITELA